MARVSVFWGIVALCLFHALPCTAQPQVWHQGISQTNINVRGNPVVVGSITIDLPEAGNVLVQFDGTCVGTYGDRIILASSNTPGWYVNDGEVGVEPVSADINCCGFSHTRMYSVAAGSHTYYAVSENYVEMDGSGIVSIYASLTVKFFPSSGEAIVQHQGINQANVNVRGADVVVGQQPIQVSLAGYILVRFDGFCIASPGDLIVLAASNTPHWTVNDGNVGVEAVDSDINRISFSHSRWYPISPGIDTFYAVARNYVEQDGSGIASIYGSLTVEYFPNLPNHAVVGQQGIVQTNINVRGNPVIVSQINLDLPMAGTVLLHFDGQCVASVGDAIVLAASNTPDWFPNDGCVVMEAANADQIEYPFSHTRAYEMTSGQHTCYAILENYVEEDGNGIASVYGSLTVEYIPQAAPEEVADQSQTIVNYGFWFEQSIPRWQEFFPALNNLSAVEVFVIRAGSAGDMIVQIRTSGDSLLGEEIIPEASIPSNDWIRADFSPIVTLIPGESYRIQVLTNAPSPDPNNRYFWEGNTTSSYPGITSVYGGWPNFDFAFITYGYLQTDIGNSEMPIPEKFKLSQNFPNPFNAKTTIKYSLSSQSPVSIDIFDILGRKIETLVEGIMPAGEHQVTWDANSQSSGIYFYRIKANDKVEKKRMLLLK